MTRSRRSRGRNNTPLSPTIRLISSGVLLILLIIPMVKRCAASSHHDSDGKASSHTPSYTSDYDLSSTDASPSDTKSESLGIPLSQLEEVRHADGTPFDVTRYHGFQLAFNKANHTPDWVSWSITRDKLDGNVPRAKNFLVDEEIDGCATPADYRKSGYDKGHMAPAADMKWHPDAMHDCFYMTNMVPQASSLNTGAWQTLEKNVRNWAKRDGSLVIVAGPIYDSTSQQRIGDTGVRVPASFFKVILATDLETPRAIAFLYPNSAAPGNMRDYSTTVDDIEAITGLDFFYNLPDEIEKKVESATSFTAWEYNL